MVKTKNSRAYLSPERGDVGAATVVALIDVELSSKERQRKEEREVVNR